MDVIPPSGTVLNSGVLCLIDSSDIHQHLPLRLHFFKVQHPRPRLRQVSIYSTTQNSFPTSTLRLSVGQLGLFFEKVLCLDSGIVVALYNMDWSLKLLASSTTNVREMCAREHTSNTHLTHI